MYHQHDIQLSLTCLQHAFGTKDGLNQHARGLAEFVKKRGGMKGIGGVLRIKICRYARISSTLSIFVSDLQSTGLT